MTDRHTPPARWDLARPPRWAWTVALAGSLCAHAMLVPLLAWSGGTGRSGGAVEADLRLGVAQSRAVTLTWLGVESPDEAAADPESGEVDQSAFTTEPGDGAEPQADAEPLWTAPEPVEVPFLPPGDVDRPADVVLPAPTERTAIPEPRPEAEPVPAGGDPGVQAERESTVSTIEQQLDVRPGAVVSAEGLEVLTRRIRWSRLEQRTKLPLDPVVVLRFGADGKPARVTIARSEMGARLGTGYRDLDETLLYALYRWRARGARIEALGDGDTLQVRLRILMGAR